MLLTTLWLVLHIPAQQAIVAFPRAPYTWPAFAFSPTPSKLATKYLGILAKHQPAADPPRYRAKNSHAKYLHARGLLQPEPGLKHVMRLLVVVRESAGDPIRYLVMLHKNADSGKLLPPLDHYLPYNYPLPYWLLRCGRTKEGARYAANSTEW